MPTSTASIVGLATVGDSWRVRAGESLFDYLPGQSTDMNFPSQVFTQNGVSPVQVRSALTTGQEAGVEEALLDVCVFDVAATGDFLDLPMLR